MKRLFLILFLLPFISGCWDKVEIEQRAFVTSIGIDVNQGQEEKNKLTVTYQYPNINAIGKNAGVGSPNYLLTANSSSVFQAGRQFVSREPFPFHYKHLKVIILGEDLLKEESLLRAVLDELNRDTKVNKRVRIIAADRTAKEIMEASFNKEQRTEGTIYATVRDNTKTGSFTSKSLADLITDFDISGVTLVPKISLDEQNNFVISGGAILKDYKFLGWIDASENKIINLINGNMIVDTLDVIYEGHLISFVITETITNRNIKFDHEIKANIDVLVEGYLQGYVLSDKNTVGDNETVLSMERTLEEEIMKVVNRTLIHLKDIKADLLGIGEHISKFHPKKWEKIEDQWDEVFADAKININVDVKMRRIGLTK